MSYRRKAPPTKTLSVTQQLNKVCNAVAGPLPFQTHNAVSLLEQMKEFQRPLFDKFSKEASVQKFYPARVVSEGLLPNPQLYTIPLPTYFIHPEDSAEDFSPRSFYHASSVENADKLAKLPQNAYAPRCASTGLFYTREEVVDNLQAAASDLGFKSPFWLHPDHPGLQSGFLSVRDGSESICISLTASAVSLDNVVPFDPRLLHPSLQKLISPRTSAVAATPDIPLGMNALSGKVCMNPHVQQWPNRGLWLSHEQLLLNGLSLSNTSSVHTSYAKRTSPFTVVEVEQWELYNADQLTVPGRLGLRRAMGFEGTDQVFQRV